MTYLPGDAFHPAPIFEDREFWEHCANKRLCFQACASCGTLRHPPTPVCPVCHSSGTVWREAPPLAQIFTYTIIHHAADERIRASLPYVVAVLEFPGFGPVKLVSNIVAPPESVHIGMMVRLFWEEAAGGMFLPRFRPEDGA